MKLPNIKNFFYRLLNKIVRQPLIEFLTPEVLYKKVKSYALTHREVLFIHSPFRSGENILESAIFALNFRGKTHGYHPQMNEKYKKAIEHYNLKAKEFDDFYQFKSEFGKEVKNAFESLVEETQDFKLFSNIPLGQLTIHPFVKKVIFPCSKFIWLDKNEEDWVNNSKKWQFVFKGEYPKAEEKWQADPEQEKSKLLKAKNEGLAEFKKLLFTFPKDTLMFDIDKPAWKPLAEYLELAEPDRCFPTQEDDVVIIHSPFKTGTTSLGEALIKMGYSNHDHGHHRDLELKYKDNVEAANNLAIRFDDFYKFKKAHQQEVIELLRSMFAYTEGCKIFGDIPFGHLMIDPFVKKLLMPHAKFIWIHREEKPWLVSAKKWHYKHPEVYQDEIQQWENNPDLALQNLLKMRNEGFKRFNKLQKDFPQDCLIVSLETLGWEPLAAFLKLPIPDEEFPVLNKGNS